MVLKSSSAELDIKKAQTGRARRNNNGVQMRVLHVCPYCGLTTDPLAYHEDPSDCQAAMRALTSRLRKFLPTVSPSITAWEAKDHMTGDMNELYQELAFRVGVGPEFEEDKICLIATPL